MKPTFASYSEIANSYAVESNVQANSRSYFGDVIENGVRFNPRNLNQIARAVTQRGIESGEIPKGEVTQIRLSTPILDDCIAKCLVGTPVIEDAVNHPEEVVESFAKMEETFA